MAEGGLLDIHYWPKTADKEVVKGREYISSQPELQGDSSDTVLCLDISQSMKGKAFDNMIRTAKTFVYGLMSVAEQLKQEENISIVTFGHETKIVNYLCKDYKLLIRVLDTLHAGGPSPLEGGLLLSLASLLAKPVHNLQSYHIRPRIIVMTDGIITPSVIISGNDNQFIELEDRITIELKRATTTIQKARYIIYCIPFGASNQKYFDVLTETTGGQVIVADEIQRLIHMNSNCIRATNIKQYHCIPGEDWKSIMKQSLGDDLSEKDFDFVVSMAELATTVEGPQYKEFDTNMLPIGTRVRRGPDWKYGDQDENGVGTIISHSENKWLWVQWDHGGINIYPYNDSTGYSIVVVDEPRQLSHQKSIDVGICVVRGPDWKSGNEDGGPGNTGICFRKENNMVSVRWKNGFIGKYRFGKEDCYDIKMSASSHSNTSQSDYTFEKRLLEPQSGEKSYFEFDTQPELSNEISIESKDVVHREDPDDNASETFEKCLNEERCSNKISKMIIWKYFQSGTWKTFDSTLSDNLERDYLLGRKTKAIQIDNCNYRVKFMPMVLRNIQTSEECKVEREESTIPQEVLTMDKEWIDLYKQSLIKGKEKVHNIRVMVVGPEGVGKTVLTKRLLKHYVDITQRQSTNGIDVHIEKCGTKISDGTWEFNKDKLDKANRFENRLVNVMQQIPSNPIGDDLDDTENTITLSESPREMLADNKSPEQTILPDFHEIEDGHGKEANSFDNENTKPLMLESTTVQQEKLFSDIVKPKDLESENKEEMMKLIKDTFDKSEISEKEVLGEISFWDFGGQIVFYSTHQTFLTPRAVYIVVIDMSKTLQNIVDRPCFTDKTGKTQWNYEDYLLFWLKSIKTYGSDNKGTVIPPIIIVATHLDKVKEEIRKKSKPEEVEEELKKEVKKFKKDLYEELRRHSVRPLVDDFIAIDNTVEDKNLERLRKAIVSLSSKQSHWGEEKPASWIFLEKKILEQKKQNMKIISFEGIEELNAQTEYPIGSETELQMFLTFHHAVGNIVYFNEEDLNKFIILNPQWLIDAFKLILTSDEFVIKNDQDTFKKWDDLDQFGILHPSLIDTLWKQDQENLFFEYKEHIILIMKNLDIIAKPTFEDKTDENSVNFFVPSRLKTKLSSNELSKVTRGSIATPYFCFVFDFLPSAVFHSLLAACMKKWSISKRDKTNLLYCGCGMFDLASNKNHRLLICFVRNIIQLKIYRYDTRNHLPETQHCLDVRQFVEQKLNRILSRTQQCIKFTPYIRCKMASFHTTEGLLKVEELLEEKQLTCHEHESIKSHPVFSFDLLKCWCADELATRRNISFIEHQAYQFQSSDNYSMNENYRFEEYDRTPSDTELNRLAKKIGPKFKRLGLALGVSDSVIETIKAENRDDVSSQCYEVLKKWTQMMGDDATLEYLGRKMKEEDIDGRILTEAIDYQ